jgi:hypothetical protein
LTDNLATIDRHQFRLLLFSCPLNTLKLTTRRSMVIVITDNSNVDAHTRRLYHHNLWQDTFEGDEFFEAFRQQPVTYLMERSPGMTRDVAEFLAERVFRIFPDCPSADINTDPQAWAKYEQDIARARVSAGELGEWVRNLPALFFNNTAPGAAPGAGNAGSEAPVSLVTSAAPDSRRSSLHSAIAAGLTHTPDCVHSQLQEAAVLDTEDEEDEDEVASMFADKTFTQADARRSSFERDEDEEDYGIMLHTGTTPILPGLVPNTRSSPSTARSIPVPPRSPPRSSPLPSEPIPLAHPVGDIRFINGNVGSSAMASASNGECMACSYDEQLGLGLSGAMNPVEAEGEDPKRGASGRSRRRGRRKKEPSVSGVAGPNAGASSETLPPTHLDHLAQYTQNLARELSRTRPQSTPRPRSTSRSRSRAPTASHQTAVPPIPALPTSIPTGETASSPLDFPAVDPSSPSLPPSVAAAVSKKSSRWYLLGSWRDRDGDSAQAASERSERAANILKGLDPTYRPSPRSTAGGSKSQTSSSSSSSSHYSSFDSAHRSSVSSVSTAATTVSTPSSIAFVPPPLPQNLATSAGSDVSSNGAAWRGRQQQQRNGWDSSSPPARSGLHERWERSPVSSTYSPRSNATTVTSWRKDQNGSVPASAASSMYNGFLGGGSSSASSTFTRFRNGSETSFSTTATSAPASSVFNIGGVGVLGQHHDKKPQSPPARPPPKPTSPLAKQQQRPARPPNVKRMCCRCRPMRAMY